MTRYRIPKHQTRIEIRVSNSRFITTIAPAATVKEAQDFLRRIRNEMPEATHHVYAFKIGYGASVSEGVSDHGEPSGTAGPPTLAVLRGAGIGDVVLVTTRYFGGTKLGTGGLVAAYQEAAKTALAALTTVEKIHRLSFEIEVPYRLHEPIRRLLADHDCLIDEEAFEANVLVRFQVPEDGLAACTRALKNLSSGQIALKALES